MPQSDLNHINDEIFDLPTLQPERDDSEFFHLKLHPTTYITLENERNALQAFDFKPSIHLYGNAKILTAKAAPETIRQYMVNLLQGTTLPQILHHEARIPSDPHLVLNRAAYEQLALYRNQLRRFIRARPDLHMLGNAFLLASISDTKIIETTIINLLLGQD